MALPLGQVQATMVSWRTLPTLTNPTKTLLMYTNSVLGSISTLSSLLGHKVYPRVWAENSMSKFRMHWIRWIQLTDRIGTVAPSTRRHLNKISILGCKGSLEDKPVSRARFCKTVIQTNSIQQLPLIKTHKTISIIWLCRRLQAKGLIRWTRMEELVVEEFKGRATLDARTTHRPKIRTNSIWETSSWLKQVQVQACLQVAVEPKIKIKWIRLAPIYWTLSKRGKN